nr:ras-related protein Rab-34 [Ciona intestinalis]|eukprot:XP_002122116.1 ras-related protein Rab-34 [Ciona intestinalis]
MAESGYHSRIAQVHSDRVVTKFPEAFCKAARVDQKYDFDPRIRQSCSSERINNVSLKICKMIIIGDVSVGKTSLVNRFCKKAFDKDYKATIGVDFEVERFEILNTPFTLQMWDTAGQERFQCIAAAYYRGAHIVSIVFDLSDINTLASATKWLEAAQKENKGAGELLVFLVGTKKDLVAPQTYKEVEKEAIQVARQLNAEYWAVSAKTNEKVRDFFFRVASLSFEGTVLRELEKRQFTPVSQIGDGVSIQLNRNNPPPPRSSKTQCCKT